MLSITETEIYEKLKLLEREIYKMKTALLKTEGREKPSESRSPWREFGKELRLQRKMSKPHRNPFSPKIMTYRSF